MRRWGRTVAGGAGAGLGCAVLVAWACALASGPARFDPQLTAQLRRECFAAADRGEPLVWFDSAWRFPGLRVLVQRDASAPQRRAHAVCAGWPWAALRGGRVPAGGEGPAAHRGALELPIQIELVSALPSGKTHSHFRLPRLLPLAPLWPGLLADTALFGAAVMLWGPGTGALRGLWRRRRGRCPHCGYDLHRAVARGCPECGWRRSDAAPASA